MARFIGIPFSPWSEKARWALDHHRIDYRFEPHILGVGELKLRLLLGKPWGRVTAPVFGDGGRWFDDSFAIARYADQIGRSDKLIPTGMLPEVAAWNKRSEDALAAGRAIMMIPTARSLKATRAALPRGIPDALLPIALPVASAIFKRFVRKYEMGDDTSPYERVAANVLLELRSALAGGKRYLLGDFSYADIAMAASLQFVTPVDERFMQTGPGGPRAWSHRAFAERFPDLLAWRDAIYEKHRKVTG